MAQAKPSAARPSARHENAADFMFSLPERPPWRRFRERRTGLDRLETDRVKQELDVVILVQQPIDNDLLRFCFIRSPSC
jgi:hypothetical protein